MSIKIEPNHRRFQRVELLLKKDRYYKSLLSKETIAVARSSGGTQLFAPEVIAVTNAVHEHGLDSRDAPSGQIYEIAKATIGSNESTVPATNGHADADETPVKRGRGRPPKSTTVAAPKVTAAKAAATAAPVETPVKRGRGRPRKVQVVAAPEAPVKRSRGRPPKIITAPVAKVAAVKAPVPVKRGRGRPPKVQAVVAPVVAPKRGRGRPLKAQAVAAVVAALTATPVKRGRGRPPKVQAAIVVAPETPVKRGRGRPPKQKVASPPSSKNGGSEKKSGAPFAEPKATEPEAVPATSVAEEIEEIDTETTAFKGGGGSVKGDPRKKGRPWWLQFCVSLLNLLATAEQMIVAEDRTSMGERNARSISDIIKYYNQQAVVNFPDEEKESA